MSCVWRICEKTIKWFATESRTVQFLFEKSYYCRWKIEITKSNCYRRINLGLFDALFCLRKLGVRNQTSSLNFTGFTQKSQNFPGVAPRTPVWVGGVPYLPYPHRIFPGGALDSTDTDKTLTRNAEQEMRDRTKHRTRAVLRRFLAKDQSTQSWLQRLVWCSESPHTVGFPPFSLLGPMQCSGKSPIAIVLDRLKLPRTSWKIEKYHSDQS